MRKTRRNIDDIRETCRHIEFAIRVAPTPGNHAAIGEECHGVLYPGGYSPDRAVESCVGTLVPIIGAPTADCAVCFECK